MNTDLRKLLEYLLAEEELEEQNVLGAGNVAGTSAAPGFTGGFRTPPESNLNEVNTVAGTTYIVGQVDSSNVSLSENDGEVGEDTERPLRKKKKKKFNFKKTKQGYNPTYDTMWNYGDKPTGKLPINKVKYVALEEQVSLKKKADRVRIFQDKGHPMKQESLNVLIDFIKFCNSILKMEDMPDIYLHTIKKPDMTTGMYSRGEHMIHVLVGKRLLVDVLRTIAHELTHARQEETGLLDIHLANVDPMDEMGDIDTPYENEAYTLAGNIVKIFCRKYRRIPKDELYQLNENKRYL